MAMRSFSITSSGVTGFRTPCRSRYGVSPSAPEFRVEQVLPGLAVDSTRPELGFEKLLHHLLGIPRISDTMSVSLRRFSLTDGV